MIEPKRPLVVPNSARKYFYLQCYACNTFSSFAALVTESIFKTQICPHCKTHIPVPSNTNFVIGVLAYD